jgi:hypothetical protein
MYKSMSPTTSILQPESSIVGLHSTLSPACQCSHPSQAGNLQIFPHLLYIHSHLQLQKLELFILTHQLVTLCVSDDLTHFWLFVIVHINWHFSISVTCGFIILHVGTQWHIWGLEFDASGLYSSKCSWVVYVLLLYM